jgi:predicted dinucleotide-binding enzyme
MTKLAVFGVGRVGAAVARTAIEAGYDVSVAGSGGPDDIALLAEIVIPGARPLSAGDAARAADVVVLAVPLHKYRSIDPEVLKGKIVIDAMNHWAPVDGVIAEFDADQRGTSEIVADYFEGARIVKTLNHIGYHDLEDQARRGSEEGRRALAFATDHADAADVTRELIDRFGFDSVWSGPLATGVAFEPATAIFEGAFDRGELRRQLDAVLSASSIAS